MKAGTACQMVSHPPEALCIVIAAAFNVQEGLIPAGVGPGDLAV
jgi:hypothetical protein